MVLATKRDRIMRARIAPLLVALLAVSAPAFADTVVLRDGRRLQGRTESVGDEIVIRQKHGEVRVAKADIVRIEHEDDVYSQLDRKQHDLGNGTADERYTLGVWCRDNHLDTESRAAFLSVLKLDPDHSGARAALGYVREDNRWITEDDQMRARGLVKLDNRWVTPAEKVRAEAEAADKKVKAREAAKKAEEDKEAKRRAKLDAEREARLARIQAYEEELARARARRRAEEESDPGYSYYSGFVGPYGVYGDPYGYGGYIGGYRPYYYGIGLSTNDQLALYAKLRAQSRTGSIYGTTTGYGYGSSTYGLSGSYYGTTGSGAYYGSSSYGGMGLGVGLSGSYTSRSGRTQIRVRTGF
jgi:hypothetical protein